MYSINNDDDNNNYLCKIMLINDWILFSKRTSYLNFNKNNYTSIQNSDFTEPEQLNTVILIWNIISSGKQYMYNNLTGSVPGYY